MRLDQSISMTVQSSVDDVNGQLYSIPSCHGDVPLSRGAPTNKLNQPIHNLYRHTNTSLPRRPQHDVLIDSCQLSVSVTTQWQHTTLTIKMEML